MYQPVFMLPHFPLCMFQIRTEHFTHELIRVCNLSLCYAEAYVADIWSKNLDPIKECSCTGILFNGGDILAIVSSPWARLSVSSLLSARTVGRAALQVQEELFGSLIRLLQSETSIALDLEDHNHTNNHVSFIAAVSLEILNWLILINKGKWKSANMDQKAVISVNDHLFNVHSLFQVQLYWKRSWMRIECCSGAQPGKSLAFRETLMGLEGLKGPMPWLARLSFS